MKILPFDIAVIEGDTHITEWVKARGALDIAHGMLAPFHRYVPQGGCVVDVGANIGDHTVTYADWVGPTGKVYAFEPNTEAFECLEYNMRHLPQVLLQGVALGDKPGRAEIARDKNAGASHLHGDMGDIEVRTLDSFNIERIDFLKIDAEGYEPKILRGARDTLLRCRPIMVAEVTESHLVRAGGSRDELFQLFAELNYSVRIIDKKTKYTDIQYDVQCVPIAAKV